MRSRLAFARSRRPASPRRRLWMGALLAAMVLLQSFGLIHRTAHAPHAAALMAGTAVAAEASVTTAETRCAGWVKALFAGHTEGTACVLYDQLGQADGLAALPVLPLPEVMAIRPEAVHPAWLLAHQAAGFLARGPPTTA